MKALRYLLVLFSSVAKASETITFKPAFSSKIHWFNYGSVLVILLLATFYIAKKNKPVSTKKSLCQIVEKKYLGNKTVVYVIDYQQQRFLLADNQQSLALHPFKPEGNNEQA